MRQSRDSRKAYRRNKQQQAVDAKAADAEAGAADVDVRLDLKGFAVGLKGACGGVFFRAGGGATAEPAPPRFYDSKLHIY